MTIDKARRRQLVARWHRRFAIFISLWLVVLAVTGMTINHAHDWGLDSKPLPPVFQRWVYGIEASDEKFCGPDVAIKAECSRVFAALVLPAGSLLLTKDSLLLVDESGQLVEKLAVGVVGLSDLQAGYQDGATIYLRDAHKTIRTDSELMEHSVITAEEANGLNEFGWQERGETAQAITWERLMLDLHAARFLGSFAKLVNDLVAVIILIMAASGLWMYLLKRKANGQSN